MSLRARQAVGVAVAAIITAGTGWAQVKPACDSSGKLKSPELVQGQVSKVDRAGGKLSVRTSGGEEYEFLASNETLEGIKVGDSIKAKLREAPRCQEK
jgi:hypothetical protein